MLVAEEVGGSSGGENQIIIIHFPYGSLYDFLFGKHRPHLCHAEIKVISVLKDFAERERY